MSAHTPGPWTIDMDGIERGAEVCAGDDQSVANCSKEDARLIAAAPELLEALQELREAELFDDDDPRLIFARQKTDAVIAKATGAQA